MSIGSEVKTAAPPTAPGSEEQRPRLYRWHRRVLGFCFAVFALEIGLILIVFPWRMAWDVNWVALQSPHLHAVWMSPYFRGALSGLGLVNIYVGLSELFRQVRSLFQ